MITEDTVLEYDIFNIDGVVHITYLVDVEGVETVIDVYVSGSSQLRNFVCIKEGDKIRHMTYEGNTCVPSGESYV